MVVTTTFAQKVTLDGYIFEEFNRGYLNEVKVTILEKSGVLVTEAMSDTIGHFAVLVDAGKEYEILYQKKLFETATDKVSTMDKKVGEKVFIKRVMARLPGYFLDATLAEKRYSEGVNVDAINGARIEIFNLTTNTEVLVIDSARGPQFSTTLQQGNHYVILTRKKGYYSRRMDAHVNIDGCYLCMEGFGTVNPGIVSNITSAKNNTTGTLGANIDMEKVDTNRNLVLQNIYYAYNSYDLTPEAVKELDKITTLLKLNSGLVVELGSHTDSRGSDESNLKLSEARAQAAVNYILSSGWVGKDRLRGKGYGETQLTNPCENGVPCSEAEHLKNRRTELKIVGFTTDVNEYKSLAEIIHYEDMMKFIASGNTETKQYQAPQATPSVNTVADVSSKSVAVPETPKPTAKETPNTQIVTPNKPIITPKSQPTMHDLESGGMSSPANKPLPTVIVSPKTQATETPKTTATVASNASKTATKQPVPTPKTTASDVPTAYNKPVVKKPTTPQSAMEKLENGTSPVVIEKKPEALPQPPIVTPPVVIEKPKPVENIKINLYDIEKTFTGYKIEVMTKPSGLTAENSELQPIARDFLSDIVCEKLADGQYSVLIGTFLTWAETERYLDKVNAKFPNAKIIEYFNGKRL